MTLFSAVGAASVAFANALRPATPVAAKPAVAIAPRHAPQPETKLNWVQQQINIDLLCMAFPGNKRANLVKWVKPTQDACYRWGVDTMREVASFLANINIESAGLTRLEENLNYSTEVIANSKPNVPGLTPATAAGVRVVGPR